MKVTVDVENKTFIRLLCIVVGFILGAFIIWKMWPALMILVVAFFLALVLNAPVSTLARKLPGQSRIAATALSYFVVLGVLGMFIYVAVPPVIEQTSKFIAALPEYVQDLSSKRGLVADLINQYGLHDQLNQIVTSAQQQAAGVAQGIGNSLVNGVSSILTGVVTLLTVLVLAFLMLIEGPRWLERIHNLYNDDAKLQRHRRLAGKMYKVVSGYVNGQIVVAAIAAGLGLVTLLLLTYFFDVPFEAVIPLTGLIFITDLVPMIGATFGAVIVAIVLVFTDPAAAVVFVLYFIVYQQVENNFIQPLVQSRTVSLSALSVFIALILGIALLGLVGGIIAIPVAGCIRIFILDYMEHRGRKAAVKPTLASRIKQVVSSES